MVENEKKLSEKPIGILEKEFTICFNASLMEK